MSSFSNGNILYTELAEWWPLLSAPEGYAEESSIYRRALIKNSKKRPRTLLELGSGGGNNASHLKKTFELTLVDLSEKMLSVSRKLNPECVHIQGEMRTIHLGKAFDAVFIHDAIVYMTTKEALQQAITTAFEHCRPGGVALFVPDWTREYFQPSTSHGGHDSGNRGLRYLKWTIDHDPTDDQYSFYMTYLLREGNSITQSDIDKHECGLFSERDWLKIMEDVGFEPKKLPYDHSTFQKGTHFMFLGLRPER